MNTPSPASPQNVCPKCGRPIPEGSPHGLCPLCLIGEVAKEDSPSAAAPGPELDELRRAFPTLEIIEQLGVGGMGRVYKVRQPHLDRFGALKLLPPGLADDPAWVERFTREARALARLNHPGIVQVYDFGEASSLSEQGTAKKFPFLLMEFVDGVNLRQALRSGNLTAAEALSVVPPICAALQYAHNQGVLHRDIKPENILLDADGRVKIADFGVAKLAGAPGTPGATLTATGAQLGTAAYMAPEQIERPQDVDHRADIYSLGVVFYELLTGELPLGRFLAPSEKAGTDPRLDTIVFRTLEKERERRFQTAGEVKSEVEHVTSSQPPPMPAASDLASRASVAVTPRKTVVLVLSLVVLPFLLLGLSLLLPMAARSGGSWANFGLGFVGAMLLTATLTVVGFTWLFRRLQRAGISTAMAALMVGLGLILIPPAGCVTAIMIPAYMTHRTQRVEPMADGQVQLQRKATLKAEKKLTTHWRFTSRSPMWITVDFRGARRSMELRPDGTGQYSAELDAEIVLDFTRSMARLHIALGNGKDKSAGEVPFLAPADGWFDRVYDHSTADGLYGSGEYLLAQIGSDQLSLTISPIEPPKSEGFVNFTVKSVSVHDADKMTILSLEYTDDVEGDAELYFKTEGMEESPPPSDWTKPVSDRVELWRNRVWRMPAGVDPKVRQQMESAIKSQYLNKTVKVPVGQVWPFFHATLPDGSTARVVMGARDGKRDVKGQPLEPQLGASKTMNAASPGAPGQPFELQLSSSQTNYGVSALWKVKSSTPIWVTVRYEDVSVNAEPREVDGRYLVEIKGAVLRNVAPNASAFTFSASTGVGGRIEETEVRFPDPQSSLRNFPIVVPDGVHEWGKPITIMYLYKVPVTVTVSAQPLLVEPKVQFTVHDVSLTEEEGNLVLNVDYVARGDAELYFEEGGIPASSYAAADPKVAFLSRRVWKLPANVDAAIRKQLEQEIESQYLQKTIGIRAGQRLPFFKVPLPDGKVANVSIGARDRSLESR